MTLTAGTERDLALLAEREQLLYEGLKSSSVEVLGEVMADDGIYIHSPGVAETKRENLIGQASGLYRHGTVRRLDGDTDVYGDMAVTSGAIEMVDIAHDSVLHLEQTLIWIREPGTWRLLLRQATKSSGGKGTRPAASTGPGRPPGADPGETAAAGAEVRAREEAFYAAQASSDASALDGLMSERLTWFVHTTGRVDDKVTYLAQVRSGAYRHGRIQVISSDTRVLGSGAVTVGVLDMPVLPADGAKPFTMRVNHVLAWAREGGTWSLVARQATRQPL